MKILYICQVYQLFQTSWDQDTSKVAAGFKPSNMEYIHWLCCQLCLLVLVNLFKYFWHIHLVPVAAGFKPSNAGLLFDCTSNCTSTAYHVNQIICHLQPAPAVARFKCSNMELFIGCATNCTNTAGHVSQIFLPFTSPDSSSGTQTLIHGIISWLFYQLCCWHWSSCPSFLPFSPGISSGRIQTL